MAGNMTLAKFALILVVVVDIMGQGLLLPILTTLMMEPSTGFLPVDTPVVTRHFNYGLVLATFSFSWFLGSVYISKLSDSIGRKQGILLCLSGTLVGYLLTIPALRVGSLWLLIAGRVVTGFTAGSQPIAKAAVVDLSHDNAEKVQNLGYTATGMSLGLVIGPIIGGVLSNKALLGNIASLRLPIYAASGLVLFSMGMICLFFQDVRKERVPLRIKPQDIFLLLWQVTQRPIVLRISLVFFWYMFAMNTFSLFMDNYLFSRFQLDTAGTSIAMLIFGASLAFSSTYLVPIANKHFSKRSIITGGLMGGALAVAVFILSPLTSLAYLAIVPVGLLFSLGYPILLSMFSESVDDSEQGWVMGVTTAQLTLGAGLTSLLGVSLIGQGIRVPFLISITSALLALVLITTVWQTSKMRQLTQ